MEPEIKPSNLLSDAFDRDRLHHYIFIWLILPAAWNLGNLLDYILSFDHFAENCVLARQPGGGRDGDEKLRAVSIGAGIGHGEFPGFIELVRRALGFVFKLVAGPTHPSSLGIAALDHEVGNYAMENRSIVESVFRFLSRRGMGPLALALREFHEIGNSFGRLFIEEAADDVAFAGFECGVESGLARHRVLSEVSLVVCDAAANNVAAVSSMAFSEWALPASSLASLAWLPALWMQRVQSLRE
jgi:hypothetical protein